MSGGGGGGPMARAVGMINQAPAQGATRRAPPGAAGRN
jgi:hypothetical protein